ncbi:MAG: diaminopimelate epimerase [Candidatus Marinimicrobia bacterium]|nr:diaminopimelate epimerase [Candidatus Neomarinimicrobiota bacterium]
MTQFHKYVAVGNDFIIFNCWDSYFELDPAQLRSLCDRRFGIGADGVMLLGNAKDHDFRMHYYNADGSRGEMCGNGARALTKYAFTLGNIPSSGTFLADDGPHEYHIKDDQIEVEILVDDVLKEWDLPLPGSACINTGVPHLITVVESVDTVELDALGREMNSHAAHPEGTNLNVIERVRDKILVRTWERGVNMETLACGTGATAASIFANQRWGKSWPIILSFKGGDLRVDFRNDRYWLSGNAELVFIGQITLSKIHSE